MTRFTSLLVAMGKNFALAVVVAPLLAVLCLLLLDPPKTASDLGDLPMGLLWVLLVTGPMAPVHTLTVWGLAQVLDPQKVHRPILGVVSALVAVLGATVIGFIFDSAGQAVESTRPFMLAVLLSYGFLSPWPSTPSRAYYDGA